MAMSTIHPTLGAESRTSRGFEWVKTLGVGICTAAFVFLSVIGWLTLQNTYATVHGHNGELNQLKTDENTVVRIGSYLGQTQYVICRGLHLSCPPPPNNSPAQPHRTRSLR
jgi:hypothetical protein